MPNAWHRFKWEAPEPIVFLALIRFEGLRRYYYLKNDRKMKSRKSRVSDKNSGQSLTDSMAQAELELEQEQFKLSRLDYILAPLVAVLAGMWTFPYVGTSTNWDDLFYMNLSQYTTPQAWVLNRYGHVYLQKFFFWLAGDALTGTRVYWCFLFFATCVLVYWCAKMLASKGGYVIGLVAVLLFCAHPVFARLMGCTLADFTVMFLVMLATFVYLAFLAGRRKHRQLVIAVLGLIFFWAVKSKETGICLAVLFFGLGEDQKGGRSVGGFVRDIGWVCVGMLAGCVLLMLLDLIFMGDFFFSVSLSNLRLLFAFNFEPLKNPKPIMTWYTYLSLQPLLAPALLYLLVGWNMGRRSSAGHRKIAWLVPVGLLLFLDIEGLLRGHWHANPWYFNPAVGGICIWAAQFFQFNVTGLLLAKGNRLGIPKILVASVLVLVAFVLVWTFMSKTTDIAQSLRLETSEQFYANAIMPLSTTVLLIVGAMSKKRGLVVLFLSSLCLFFIIYFPLSDNLTLLKQRVVANRSEWRYEPYRVFANELQFEKDVKILVSKDIHKRSWMLGREVMSHCWMFNVFFNQKFDYDNFIDGSWGDVIKGNYTYAFLTGRDWRGIGEKYNIDHLLRDYELEVNSRAVYPIRSGQMRLVLLKKR